MKKYMPMLVASCLAIPVAVLIGLLAGGQFGPSSGVVGLMVILMVAAYSRRLSAVKKGRIPGR